MSKPTKLQVLAKKNGYRRSGIAFSDTQVTIVDTDTLTAEQTEALRKDPNLVVSEGSPAANSKAADDQAAAINAAREQLNKDREEFVTAVDALNDEHKKVEAQAAQLAEDRKAFDQEKADLAADKAAFEKEKAKGSAPAAGKQK